jgi:hypothetical protein
MRAVGWLVVIMLVLLLGTHPDQAAGLMHHALAILQGAGNEMSTFVSKL